MIFQLHSIWIISFHIQGSNILHQPLCKSFYRVSLKDGNIREENLLKNFPQIDFKIGDGRKEKAKKVATTKTCLWWKHFHLISIQNIVRARNFRWALLLSIPISDLNKTITLQNNFPSFHSRTTWWKGHISILKCTALKSEISFELLSGFFHPWFWMNWNFSFIGIFFSISTTIHRSTSLRRISRHRYIVFTKCYVHKSRIRRKLIFLLWRTEWRGKVGNTTKGK